MTQAAPIGSSPWNVNHELTWQEAGTWLELIHVAARTLRKRPFLPVVSIPAQSWFQPFQSLVLRRLLPLWVPFSFPSNKFLVPLN